MKRIADRVKKLLTAGARTEAAVVVADGRDKRIHKRRRVRFMTAKALDADGRFLCDCVILDQSDSGLRLRHPPETPPPIMFSLHDDQTQEILGVSVAWRKGAMIGVRVHHRNGVEYVPPAKRAALNSLYYAVVD